MRGLVRLTMALTTGLTALLIGGYPAAVVAAAMVTPLAHHLARRH